MTQHEILVSNAETLLPRFPIKDYGWKRMVKEARDATSVGLDPRLLECLPDVAAHFPNASDTIE